MYAVDENFNPVFAVADGSEINECCIQFALKGKPKALERARLSGRKLYDPTKKEKESFRKCLRRIMAECNVLEVPVYRKGAKLEVELVFHLPARAGKSADIDNLAKFVLDACNGLVYYDDIQVYKLTASKVACISGKDIGNTEVKVTMQK